LVLGEGRRGEGDVWGWVYGHVGMTLTNAMNIGGSSESLAARSRVFRLSGPCDRVW
jgi:hypothetical protein